MWRPSGISYQMYAPTRKKPRKITAGTGTLRIVPLPRYANLSPKPNCVTSCVIVSATPRAPANPPSVTMIGENSR